MQSPSSENPTVVTPEQFDSRIADAVVENLEKFAKAKFDQARAITRTNKQQQEFLREHVGVSVSDHEAGNLKVSALHREGGGMVSSSDHTFILSKEEIPYKLTSTIAEAFKRST